MLTDVESKAFEMKCLRRLIHISYREQKSSECVRRLVTILIGPDEPLLAKVKRRKMVWSMSLGDTLPKDSPPEMAGVRKSTRQGEKKGWVTTSRSGTGQAQLRRVHQICCSSRWTPKTGQRDSDMRPTCFANLFVACLSCLRSRRTRR